MTIWTPKLNPSITLKYRAVADALVEDIANGTLKPKDRLPTQRELATYLSVTTGTIGRAYALAEKQGLISLEIGRGSFVKSPTTISPRGEVQRTGLVDLGLNLPPQIDDRDRLSQTLLDLSHRKDLSVLFGHSPVGSLSHHRKIASDWLSPRIDCSPENLLICCGTQNALIVLLSTLSKSDQPVLVSSLTFPGMLAAAKLLNIRLIPIAMDNEGIIPTALEKVAKTGLVLYCISSNQNPTTVSMSPNRRRAIAKIVKNKKLKLIEDDVYGMLIPDCPKPIATLVPDQSFLVSSISKSISVGLRLAYLVFPSQYRRRLSEALRATAFFPPPFVVEIITNWIENGTARNFLKARQEIAMQRLQLAEEILPSHSIMFQPRGNHIWLKLPESWPASALEKATNRQGILISAGSTFAVNSDNQDRFVRLSLGAARSDAELKAGLAKIVSILDETPFSLAARY